MFVCCCGLMKYGIYTSNYALKGDPKKFVELATAAEDAGWDGFFMWDHVYPSKGDLIADPWITLAAIAAKTEKIRIGTTVTPLPRRRPQKVAREVTTLDHLSNGRFARVNQGSCSGLMGSTRMLKIPARRAARMSAKSWSPTMAVRWRWKFILPSAERSPKGSGLQAAAM